MTSRLNVARLGAAVLGASVALVLSAALPASAAGAAPQDVVATVGGGDVPGTPLTMDYTDAHGKNGPHAVTPVLIGLTLPDKTVIHTYCVELNVDLNPKVPMKESGWDSYPDQNSPFNKNKEQINWILHNSYPQADLGVLSSAAGLSAAATPKEAIAATQAAIWHYSDNATLDAGTQDAAIKTLYSYLTGSGNKGLPQPSGNNTPVANPTLSISPAKQLAGSAGSKIGPFTITTNMTGLGLTAQLPNGVSLVDGNGAAVDESKLGNGSKVYFNVPSGAASGEGSFTLSTPATVGELFVGTTEGQNGTLQRHGARGNCSPEVVTQTLIVAQTSVSASASAQWVANVVTSTTTTAPTTTTTAPSTGATATTSSAPAVAAPTTTNTSGGSSLPFTGVSLIAPIALAIVLIGGGATFLLLQRRKRAAQH